MEIEYISSPKVKQEIRRADLTCDQVCLCCMPRPAVPVNQMHNTQDKSNDEGLGPVRRKYAPRVAWWLHTVAHGCTSATGEIGWLHTPMRVDKNQF